MRQMWFTGSSVRISLPYPSRHIRNGVLIFTMSPFLLPFSLIFFLFIYDSQREREREAETQAEGEAGSMHREPDVGFDPWSPGPRPGPKAGAKPLRHPVIPLLPFSVWPLYLLLCVKCLVRLQFFFRSNCSIYRYRFGVSVG